MQARQIESELEAKTNAFAKLCSGYDGAYTARGESGLAAEQVSIMLHAECICFQYQAYALSNCQCLLFGYSLLHPHLEEDVGSFLSACLLKICTKTSDVCP